MRKGTHVRAPGTYKSWKNQRPKGIVARTDADTDLATVLPPEPLSLVRAAIARSIDLRSSLVSFGGEDANFSNFCESANSITEWSSVGTDLILPTVFSAASAEGGFLKCGKVQVFLGG